MPLIWVPSGQVKSYYQKVTNSNAIIGVECLFGVVGPLLFNVLIRFYMLGNSHIEIVFPIVLTTRESVFSLWRKFLQCETMYCISFLLLLNTKTALNFLLQSPLTIYFLFTNFPLQLVRTVNEWKAAGELAGWKTSSSSNSLLWLSFQPAAVGSPSLFSARPEVAGESVLETPWTRPFPRNPFCTSASRLEFERETNLLLWVLLETPVDAVCIVCSFPNLASSSCFSVIPCSEL